MVQPGLWRRQRGRSAGPEDGGWRPWASKVRLLGGRCTGRTLTSAATVMTAATTDVLSRPLEKTGELGPGFTKEQLRVFRRIGCVQKNNSARKGGLYTEDVRVRII